MPEIVRAEAMARAKIACEPIYKRRATLKGKQSPQTRLGPLALLCHFTPSLTSPCYIVISMGAMRVDCQYLDKLLVLKHALPNDDNLFQAPYSVRWRIPVRWLINLQYIHTITDPHRLDDQPAKQSKTKPNVPCNWDSVLTHGLKHFKEVSVSLSLKQSQYSIHHWYA